eukprot:CAMPEP_0179090574 /NCGR_PEP_ID=MMETSP0796-20121207/41329_1 /TAXON_ID=73915 /ORGANISM="Pyrodinium bahamense, Strain pbaha01" /LENGTH=397 /DNA_ID=CAMNT_0020788147 /DNA_START=38 /DNA_END=1229 /DNA_ORIENTATION=+
MPLGDEAAFRLERSAVNLSLWVGGVGLASLKGLVYLATGSVLVRASMFDSLGDVFSSFIMAVTQWKVNDHRDMHRYPMGKGRFAPLGVLFFCAFMCSTMLSMALDSVQALFTDDSEETAQVEAAMAGEENRLHWGYGPDFVEAMIAQYAAGGDDEGASVDTLSTVLLGICVLVKIALYVWCRYVESRRSSEIVGALASDHRNDTLSNSMVIGTMVFLARAQSSNWNGPWLAKVDPAVSFLLSLWIIYGWVKNALEQFAVLSDQRVEDVDVEAIDQAVQGALQGSPLLFDRTEVYHAGDGYRVHLKLHPAPANAESTRMASLFDNVEGAVRSASSDVRHVDVHLRSQGPHKADSFAWVKEYKTDAVACDGSGRPVDTWALHSPRRRGSAPVGARRQVR